MVKPKKNVSESDNQPTLKVEQWPIKQLVSYAKNARTHPDPQIYQIMASIDRYGFVNPILVDAYGTIVAGHGRCLAAQQLGLKTVPVIQLGHLSEDDVRGYRIADNKIPENSGWNIELLSLEMRELRLLDYPIELLGFAPATLDVFGLNGNEVENSNGEWIGMPEFVQGDKTAFRSIVVHFKDQKSVDDFAVLMSQKITPKTRFAWFPEIEIETYADKRYVGTKE